MQDRTTLGTCTSITVEAKQRRARRTAAQAKSRAKKRHEARGELETAFWTPRFLRRMIVNMGLAKEDEINDPEQIGQGILAALIEMHRNHGHKI